ncbi:hypothetical protein J1N35_005103 [Gossypium stocksii]|uniref:RNase H type-1 domain-containing protein n=1 Tax=Gossypium stocksii TaxID=47602 RepID=A0A9D3WET3_9ROSI|nr:hypothetical protein J1N35_005103 [Gossypium stocksii]
MGLDQLIWKWMVSNKFSSKEAYKNLHQIKSNGLTTQWELSWKAKMPQRVKVIGSHWSPPKEGYVKLNTDSVMFSSRACASIGGVTRDANGLWQYGFSMSIGEGTIFQVEVRAMLEGLHLA